MSVEPTEPASLARATPPPISGDATMMFRSARHEPFSEFDPGRCPQPRAGGAPARRLPDTERRTLPRAHRERVRGLGGAHRPDSPGLGLLLCRVGEDITFDLGVIQRFGCDVYAFDPTPRAMEHVAVAAAGAERFHFFDWGFWSHDTELRFYAPRNPAFVSRSAVNPQGTSTYFVAPVRSVASTLEVLGHDRLDCLKLDVEGAEYEVLSAVLEGELRPRVVCVEFDQPTPIARTVSMIQRLRRAGYRIAHAAGWNWTFLRGSSGEGMARWDTA